MKNELAFRIFSRRPLDRCQAELQIIALSDFDRGAMRPDFCAAFEPIRTPFDRSNTPAFASWLAQPHGQFLYRSGRPRHSSGVMWNLAHSSASRFPSPVFANYWTGEFDRKWAQRMGITTIKTFVTRMFHTTGADFAILTTQVDLDAKNYAVSNEGVMNYEGLDPAHGVPGLYWVNLFSEQYSTWLGIGELTPKLARRERLSSGGVMIEFGESPDECRSVDILQRQRAAIEWLGSARFFDIRSSHRKLDTPTWE